MGVAFRHVLPNFFAGVHAQRGDAAAFSLHRELQADKEHAQLRGESRRGPDPIGADKSPQFASGFGIKAINVAIVTAEIDFSFTQRGTRPEILVSLGVNREFPDRRPVPSIEAPEDSGIAAEIDALSVG